MFDANYPEGTKRVLIVKGELPILETTITYSSGVESLYILRAKVDGVSFLYMRVLLFFSSKDFPCCL